MATSISSTLSTKLRLTGMSTGMDTDTMIKQLMSIEQAKVDKVKQQRDLLEWKRDNYREITNTLRSFQDEFFNVLKPASNMRSLNTYNIYNSTSSDSTVATATGGAGVKNTSHTIKVTQLASAATGTSTGVVTNGLTAGNSVQGFNVNGYNKTFAITYNGVTKEITIPDGNYTSASDLLGDGTDGKL